MLICEISDTFIQFQFRPEESEVLGIYVQNKRVIKLVVVSGRSLIGFKRLDTENYNSSIVVQFQAGHCCIIEFQYLVLQY